MNRLPLNAVVFLACVLSASGTPAELTGTLQKINETGKITMGVRDASFPFSYAVGKLWGSETIGYQVDVCHKVIDAIKARHKGREITVEVVPMTSANRLSLVENGTVDLGCGPVTNHAIYQKQVAFSVTTFVPEVRMAVKANSGIESTLQLNGKLASAASGDRSMEYLRKHTPKAVTFREMVTKDYVESWMRLASGRVDAIVTDDVRLAQEISHTPHPTDFKIVGEVLAVVPMGITLRKNDPAFKRVVDDAIRDLMQRGELTQIYNKWFMSPIPLDKTYTRSTPPVNLHLPMGATMAALIANPDDKRLEDYPINSGAGQ